MVHKNAPLFFINSTIYRVPMIFYYNKSSFLAQVFTVYKLFIKKDKKTYCKQKRN